MARASLGEGILYSVDGVGWFEVTNETSTGWEDAEIVKEPILDDALDYRGFVWQSLPYGWSGWLSMAKPIRARYLRYNWDIVSDRFHELELYTRGRTRSLTQDETGPLGTGRRTPWSKCITPRTSASLPASPCRCSGTISTVTVTKKIQISPRWMGGCC